MKNYRQRAVKLSITAAVLVAVLILLIVLQSIESVSEFFAVHFSRWWITAAGSVSSLLPFSLYEVFLLACFVFGVCALVVTIRRLCKRKFIAALCMFLVVVIVALSFGTIYVTTATMSYNRAQLPIARYDYATAEQPLIREQAIDFANLYIDNLNKLYSVCEHDSNGYVVSMYSLSQLTEMMHTEYERLEQQYPNYFSPYDAKAKTPLSSWLFSQFGISGVFFAPFGEININGYENTFYLPMTLAHEMAHSKGVMRENDANTVARYLCFTSDNVYIMYSAYLGTLSQVLSLVSLYPDTQAVVDDMIDTVHPKAIEQLNATVEYWDQFDLLSGVGIFFNNIYLMLSGQGGTISYNPPSQAEDSGEVDSEGNPILIIKSFSDAGNLLVQMYLDGRLTVDHAIG